MRGIERLFNNKKYKKKTSLIFEFLNPQVMKPNT